ncbi:MAG TPA: hypothetical protein VH643_05795 [Gemmataceae bacterium]
MLLALLAGSFAAPSAVHAGCDYPVAVWRGEPTSVSSSHNMPHASKPVSPLPSRSDAPCHGPTCSRRPAPSPVTIPSPPSVQVDSWALLDPRSLIPVAPPGASLDPVEPAPLIRHGRDIFHPPRSSSAF